MSFIIIFDSRVATEETKFQAEICKAVETCWHAADSGGFGRDECSNIDH